MLLLHNRPLHITLSSSHAIDAVNSLDIGDKADITDPPPYHQHHSPNCTLIEHLKYSLSSFITSATVRCIAAIDSVTHPSLSAAELKQFRDAFKYNIASSRLLDDPLSKSLSLHKDALNSSSPMRSQPSSTSAHAPFSFIPSACSKFVNHASIRSLISTAMLAVAVIFAYLQNQRNSQEYRYTYVVLTSLALSTYMYRATVSQTPAMHLFSSSTATLCPPTCMCCIT